MTTRPSPPRRVAVLLAGGTGTRAGLDRPKQLVEVHGRTILEHSLRALHDHPQVEEVVVVMPLAYVDAAREIVAGYPKVAAVIPGGRTRTESTLAALVHLGEEDCHVLFHDAARPLVTRQVITSCLEALASYAAVTPAVASADTVIEVGADGTMREALPRESLRRVQTPQAFRSAVLREAYRRAAADPGFTATDDCTVVHRYLPDVAVAVVEGDEANLKVTTPVDLVVAEALMRLSDEG